MKLTKQQMLLGAAVTALLAACSTTPQRNDTLDRAQQLVSEVEASDRAGVAANDISNARKSLEAANKLSSSKAKRADMEYEAQNAITSAQIASEKIATANARDELAKGTEQRQVVLIEAREREARRSDAAAVRSKELSDSSARRADSLESELADLKAKKTERGIVLVLGDVLFDTAQATLKSGSYETLDRLATALRDKPNRSVAIEGHTDNVPVRTSVFKDNWDLSVMRATSITRILTREGVNPKQITASGRSEFSPLASNDTPQTKQKNRRTEIIITPNLDELFSILESN